MLTPCPADPIVALSEHLRDPAGSNLGPHLEHCPYCRHRLERLQRDERLLEDLRGGLALDQPARDRIRRICESAAWD